MVTRQGRKVTFGITFPNRTGAARTLRRAITPNIGYQKYAIPFQAARGKAIWYSTPNTRPVEAVKKSGTGLRQQRRMTRITQAQGPYPSSRGPKGRQRSRPGREAGNWRCVKNERRRCDTGFCAGPSALEFICTINHALTGAPIHCRLFEPRQFFHSFVAPTGSETPAENQEPGLAIIDSVVLSSARSGSVR
jgi:hypothetical protein